MNAQVSSEQVVGHDEETAVVGPPAKFSLPRLTPREDAGGNPFESLAALAHKIGETKPPVPPTSPAPPVVFARPSVGFD